MATFTAVADVTASLLRLLRSHMLSGAEVTSAPPDIDLGATRTRVNLYLIQVRESPCLKNMDIPPRTPRGSPGRPPLSVELRYMLTAHPEREDQVDAQASAERALGDAMSVLHHYGPLIDTATIRNSAAGQVGAPILEASLIEEFERIKISLYPSDLDELTKIWSAFSSVNFRMSAIYHVSVVQIEDREPRRMPAPVETRALAFSIRRRPEIVAARLAVPPGQPQGETRLRIGDALEVEVRGAQADRLYIRIGDLDPIRVVASLAGIVQIPLPDAVYAPDLDNPLPRPIPPEDRLQAGVVEVTLEAEFDTDVIQGGLGPGVNAPAPRRYPSNLAFIQIIPEVTGTVPGAAAFGAVLQVTGTRLWRPGARTQVILGDAAVEVHRPEGGDPWAQPTDIAVEIPLDAYASHLPPPGVGGDPYPVAVQTDGARSRDPGVIFTLTQ
jgi:hypothetical protein